MPINYPELLVLLVLHLNCYHSLGFLHSSSGGGFVGKSRADTSSAKHQTSSSTSYLTANIVASSPGELGGDIIRIRTSPDDDEDSFLSRVGVPTFAVIDNEDASTIASMTAPKRLGLEGIIHNSNAFVLENALSLETCESILNTCEELQFGYYNVGKNNHGAMQIVISKAVSDTLLSLIGPHVDLEGVIDAEKELRLDNHGEEDKTIYALAGINRRFRIYRYAPDENESFAPHIDAGFPPGGSSLDDDVDNDSGGTSPYLYWDAAHQYSTTSEVVSRLTVLIYLNEDFVGGHTKFYEPLSERSDDSQGNGQVIASIKPRTGQILVFPQAVSEEAVERARYLWPLHEGSPVSSGNRPKYVIRTDVLFETIVNDELKNIPDHEKVLFEHDDAVRNVFKNTSPMLSKLFREHVWPLYNPHMGVENAGPLLYSLVRFTKCRKVVEVGAGYTTLFILQALKDNDDEMKRVVELDLEGRLRMLDYPFGTPRVEEWMTTPSQPSSSSSSLLCIDNCDHQKETASGAVSVARTLGLDSYLEFLRGDAFDALDTHFSEVESIDLLWCDFGVGSKMKLYAGNVWKYVKPGGFLVCHSTLTNTHTREWLEGIRQGMGESVTGIPEGEYTELSLLEPHKRFQNSITVIQKRIGLDGAYSEPIYSEYA